MEVGVDFRLTHAGVPSGFGNGWLESPALQEFPPLTKPQPARRILFASLIGTTIEFFDFYIYATAAVLVFPTLFFPKQDPATATLQSLATFA